ncbi:ArsR/SmtB family transcription factor [Rhodococcus sp. OK302]|uniref:ArsR/SmtB family transcription factor n=1 Tax=Rhodococcus sp. OK302 TaxID=1882769 RepID=UPI000B9F48ED|nr:metalloregulator ArsR/SmtB family transcription factor [Rhodococcus sp. OK302]OYD70394.1 DNA-binding transcriptional ArsR family regulator [Rhodococcus sp. OK302]
MLGAMEWSHDRTDSMSDAGASVDSLAEVGPMDLLRALGDPVRWSIVRQLCAVDELPCSTLEHTLNVSKPTISYHTKILIQAGLMYLRKEGRNNFYTLRPEALHALIEAVSVLAPDISPADDGVLKFPAASGRVHGQTETDRTDHPIAVGAEHVPVVTTW